MEITDSDSAEPPRFSSSVIKTPLPPIRSTDVRLKRGLLHVVMLELVAQISTRGAFCYDEQRKIIVNTVLCSAFHEIYGPYGSWNTRSSIRSSLVAHKNSALLSTMTFRASN